MKLRLTDFLEVCLYALVGLVGGSLIGYVIESLLTVFQLPLLFSESTGRFFWGLFGFLIGLSCGIIAFFDIRGNEF